MMLPAPRIIAIDDEQAHLTGLADGLNTYGIACLKVHFTGDVAAIKPCPYVRVIFADLHLNPGPAGQGHEQHFAAIGGLIGETIVPTGPYIIVLWTRFADQAHALKAFLDERLVDVPKPFAVVPLDKNAHLNADGTVRDANDLVQAIDGIVRQEVQLAALLNWEERVLGAAADTVSAMLEIGMTGAGAETPAQRLRRLLFHLAAAGVGDKHVFADRFHAVNEALLPILADRIAALKSEANRTELWEQALVEADAASGLTAAEAGSLNRLSLIADVAGTTGAARGAVIALPLNMSGASFAGNFGMSPADAAERQFGCNGFAEGDERFRWMLIQIQAACDYAQRQPGPLPFVLALELPEASAKGSPPAAVWRSPAFAQGNETRVLHANSRFQVTMADAAASGTPALYRLREQLLNALNYHVHSYGARPGHVQFREKKQKAAAQPAQAPSAPAQAPAAPPPAPPAAPKAAAKPAPAKQGKVAAKKKKKLPRRAKAK